MPSINAHHWEKYNILKEYYDFIKSQPDKSTQTEEWLQWASKKLNWYNPLTEIQEEFLDDVDKDALTFKKKTAPTYSKTISSNPP